MTTESRLIDVATAAGVSLRTASRVLNDDHRVAAATRSRVHEAMQTLDFQPDAMARSLRAGSDTTIGFVVETIADPFFAAVIETVEAAMDLCNRSVLVASTHRDHDRERGIVRRLLQRRVAGLVIAPTVDDHAWLADCPTPVVLVDRAAPGLVADLVDIDDRQAAYDAVTHLINHGHRRIAYIGDAATIPTSAARLRGYRQALSAAGIPITDDLVHSSCVTTQDAAGAATVVLADASAPAAPRAERDITAIFSGTTPASLGIIPVLHSRRRTDLAFVGMGDFAMADALTPGISVIDHSGAAIGQAAAERLLRRLGDSGAALPAEHIRLRAPLIPRGSGEIRP